MGIDMTAIYDAARFRFSNPITVTLSRPASWGGAQASITVAQVQDQMAPEEEVDSPMGGSMAGVKKTFHLWYVECMAMVPHKGYEIVMADGTTWAVDRVDRLAHGRRFRCHCTQRRAT